MQSGKRMMNRGRVIDILGQISEYALYILLFCIPLSKSVVEAAFLTAFLAWIVKKAILKETGFKPTFLNFAILGFFLANAASLVNSEYFNMSLRTLFSKTAECILLYFIIADTIKNKKSLDNVFKISLFAVAIVMADAYAQYYFLHYDLVRFYPSFSYRPLNNPRGFAFLGFPTGPFPFSNDLSAWILIFVLPLLALFIWGSKHKAQKYLLGICLFPLLYLLYLANTRGAWLGFFTALFFILLIKSRKILICLALIIAVMLPFLPAGKKSDIFGTSSMSDRCDIWSVGFDIFKEHPIIGSGLNTFFEKYRALRKDEFKGEKGSHAHNGYLQIAAETGAAGLIFFLLIIAAFLSAAFRGAYKIKSAFYRFILLGLGFGILAFLVQSFFDTNLQSLPLVMLLWYSFGITAAINNTVKQDETYQ